MMLADHSAGQQRTAQAGVAALRGRPELRATMSSIMRRRSGPDVMVFVMVSFS